MRPELYAERNAQIVQMRESGMLPRQIAKELSLTRNAVIGALNRKGKCTPGFKAPLRGEEVASAKITEADVVRLRAACHGQIGKIADELGIARPYASKVRRRATWAHVA